jgi:ABC-type lipoprotein export system ATPase subunit
MPILSCSQLTKSYRQNGSVTPVLHDISLAVDAGEFVAIMGPSGSGKSTLLHCLGLLEPIDRGDLVCLGQNAATLSDRKKAAIRRESMGFVFQSFYLIPGLTVRENILLPLLIRRFSGDRDGRVRQLLDQVGLSRREHYRPNQLSGGEQQRVALARALAGRPDILFLDEPTGNLDSKNGQEILGCIFDLVGSAGITAIMVTHDPAMADWCRRTIQIRDGRIERIDQRRTI